MHKNIIEQIQEDDPSFDPLGFALHKSKFTKEQWNSATDRIYIDGYYGPINPSEWEEQDGRTPYSVGEALSIVAKILDEVEDYRFQDDEWDTIVYAEDIKAALVHPWYKEIYGVRFP